MKSGDEDPKRREEKLWDVMSVLEQVKTDMEIICQTYQADDAVLQKRLAEIKVRLEPSQRFNRNLRLKSSCDGKKQAAILPLIVPPGSDEEQNNRDWSVESVNEIAGFDDSFNLRLNFPNWSRKFEESSKVTVSNVISVCGDTHVG